MAADKKFGLLVEMKSDIKQFQTGMGKAKGDTKKLGGAFKSMTGQMSSQFSRMTGGLGGGLGVIRSMIPAIKGVKMALISSGIGAIVVAIGVAFAAVSANINRTSEGADKWKQKMGKLKGVMDVLLDRLADLGGAVIKFIQGDYRGAWEDAKKAVAGVVDEIKEEGIARENIVKREQALRDRKRKWMVDEAKLQTEYQELLLQSRDITKSSAERQEILNKALKVQQTLGQTNTSLAKEALSIQEDSMALGHDSNEDLDKQAELQRDVHMAVTKQAQGEREVVNRIREATNSAGKFEKAMVAVNKEIDKSILKSTEVYDTMDGIVEDAIEMEDIEIIPPDFVKIKDSMYLLNMFKKDMIDFRNETNTTAKALHDILIQNLENLSGQLIQGAESFEDFGKSVKHAVKNFIGAMLAQSIAAMVTGALRDTALFSGPFGFLLAPVVGALAGGLAKTAFNSMIPDFAAGGIAYGSTLARVGEYPGARSNPEVIAPLNRLKDMLGAGGDEVVFVIKGDVLEGVRKNYYQRRQLMG